MTCHVTPCHVNLQLLSLIFPAYWYRALINPLLKTPIPASFSDTRPIAILTELSKILERDAFDQLLDFLEENSLLDSWQPCYRPGNSTQTVLIAVTHFMRKADKEYKLTIFILFDFSKALDSISHRRLLQKLRSYYLSDTATSWIYSYLCEKYQAVIREDGTIKSWHRSVSGVPQGSILGHLLFPLYINDISRILTRVLYMLYADDTQIYQSFELKQIDSGITHMQLNAQAMADWATQNGLKLNIKKSKVMIFGSLQYLTTLSKCPEPLSQIQINSVFLPYVAIVKNLGILMTPSLTWQPQVTAITNKVYSTLCSLKFHKISLS